MLRILCLCLFTLLNSQHAFAGVVLWLEGELPEEKALKKADVRTGGTGHLAANYLAYPPDPIESTDTEAYELLRLAMDEANRRWEEFEIEYAIAVGLGDVIEQVTLVRDERDRDALVSAFLFQGAATHIAFEPEDFKLDDRAEPFRYSVAGKVLNRPWLRALALDAHRIFRSSDLADGGSFPALRSSQDDIDQLEAGRIVLPALKSGEHVVWNGVEQEETVQELVVQPGRQWLHIMRDGKVYGRAVLDVTSGEEVVFPARVSEADLAQARQQVLKGTTTGFPEELKAVLSEIARIRDEAVYVAALDGGALEVLPYTRGATLAEQRLVTVVSAGELGAAVLTSDLFDQTSLGTNVSVPAAHGGIALELGLSYVSLQAGFDLAITPTHTMTYADRDVTSNVTRSALPQPYGGLGFYILRPTGATATVSMTGTVGFDFPAFMAYGGRATVGIPIDQRGNWFRMTFGAKTAPRSMWADSDIEASMSTYFFRTGFGALL